jgi:hypothetical protein
MAGIVEADYAGVSEAVDGQTAEIEAFKSTMRSLADLATNNGFKGAIQVSIAQLGERLSESVNSFEQHTQERINGMRQMNIATANSGDESGNQVNQVDTTIAPR